jgi:hypothetical protein
MFRLKICISLKQANTELITEFCDDLKRCCERIERNTPELASQPKMAVFFGVSSWFVDRDIREDLPNLFIDAYFSTPLLTKRTTRTLSIEGRKLSQIHVPS